MAKNARIVLAAFGKNVSQECKELEEMFENRLSMFEPIFSTEDQYAPSVQVWVREKAGLFTAAGFPVESGVPTFVILFKSEDYLVDLFINALRKKKVYVFPIEVAPGGATDAFFMLSSFLGSVRAFYPTVLDNVRTMRHFFELLTTLELELSDRVNDLDECYKNIVRIQLIRAISEHIGYQELPYAEEMFPEVARQMLKKIDTTVQFFLNSNEQWEFCHQLMAASHCTGLWFEQSFMQSMHRFEDASRTIFVAEDDEEEVVTNSRQCYDPSEEAFTFTEAAPPTCVSIDEEENEDEALCASAVQFSAVSPRKLEKGDYALIDIYMYEEAFKSVVEQALAEADQPSKATTSGFVDVQKKARVKVELRSPDLEIDDNVSECVWNGRYQRFSFDVSVPEDYAKKKVLFTANVYINDVIATKLKFLADCEVAAQPMQIERVNITHAFVSYASQDRDTVSMIVQGIRKARPDLQVFFDVETLRSGESWGEELKKNIDTADVLFLCWSHHAKQSQWVNYEWRYAYDSKGLEFIEPIPLENPASCPPPEELSSKHFNDLMLYIRK
ncbi:MAG: toll/interleukin-1 receptor domain-containing protein [Ruminococcaceae bacterium]|nr:toll/interleukin-1 receptor domain-containing protein [Oscillospiraceae bacterium]